MAPVRSDNVAVRDRELAVDLFRVDFGLTHLSLFPSMGLAHASSSRRAFLFTFSYPPREEHTDDGSSLAMMERRCGGRRVYHGCRRLRPPSGEDMHSDPRQPPPVPVNLRAFGQLHDGWCGRSSPSCLVVCALRTAPLAKQLNDLTSNATSLVGRAGQDAAGDNGTVADSKGTILAFDEGVDGNAASRPPQIPNSCERQAPTSHVGRESLAVLEEHGILAHLSDGGIGAHPRRACG